MQLELNTEEEAWLRGVFKKRGYPELTPNNLQQVWLPEGSRALRNDWGTAPGCYFERDGVRVIMLPGPPRRSGPCSSTACGPSSRSSPTPSSPRTTSTSTA